MDLLSTEAAKALAAEHWHVQGTLHSLPSYLDQNFRIESVSGAFILKIAHPSWARQDLDLENCAMMALADREREVDWPKVQLMPSGEHLLAVPVRRGICHVRLLSFVSGATYADVISELPASERAALHEGLGATVARLTKGLEGFRHPAATRDHPWNLTNLGALRSEGARIEDSWLRETVTTYVDTFCRRLPEWRRVLPIKVVHNDANDHNVIVSTNSNGSYRASSVIDFGDLCTSFRIANLAIACTYAMQHEADPVACARDIVRGYLMLASLTRAELAELHTFILARICQSMLMAVRAQAEQPGNPYVLVSQQGLALLLRTLSATAPTAITAPFLTSCHE